MTDTLGHPDIGTRIFAAFNRFFGFLAKAGFGVFLLAAAVFHAVRRHLHRPDAGHRLLSSSPSAAPAAARPKYARARYDPAKPSKPRRTADGWVIEL
jgi:hypothetical protein